MSCDACHGATAVEAEDGALSIEQRAGLDPSVRARLPIVDMKQAVLGFTR